MKITIECTYIREFEVEVPENLAPTFEETSDENEMVEPGTKMVWPDRFAFDDWIIDQVESSVTNQPLKWASTRAFDENDNEVYEIL